MKRFPPAPAGFVACRVMLRNATMTHLVALDEHGSNGGRPTACGLTRFNDRDDSGRAIPGTAHLPGWGMGDSGVTGPKVEQFKCADCYAHAAAVGDLQAHVARLMEQLPPLTRDDLIRMASRIDIPEPANAKKGA